jgi:glycosyltransferase involved in cell wall biosynthesis
MTTTPPIFSIVIPTLRRPRLLAACLEAIARSDFPREDFEVIVVNDGGDASTDEIVDAFAERLDIRLVKQSPSGPAMARNAGAARARGRYLVFTDDDCEPAPDWLRALLAHVAKDPASGIGGRTLNSLPDRIFSSATQALVDYLYAYYNGGDRPSGSRFFATNNLALPRRRFLALGGFDTRFPLAAAEDREMCERWQARGWRMVYADDVVIHHGHALRFTEFWRQHYNYGRGAYQLHESRVRERQRARRFESLSFYGNRVLSPFARERTPRAAALAGLLMLAQVATAVGYYRQRLAPKRTPVPDARPGAPLADLGAGAATDGAPLDDWPDAPPPPSPLTPSPPVSAPRDVSPAERPRERGA